MPDTGLGGIFDKLTRVESEVDKAREKIELLEREMTLKVDIIKEENRKTDKRVDEVQTAQALINQRMTAIEKSLEKIDDNTTHTRRQMTGIIVGAVATGIIGGAIALIYGLIGGGIV